MITRDTRDPMTPTAGMKTVIEEGLLTAMAY